MINSLDLRASRTSQTENRSFSNSGLGPSPRQEEQLRVGKRFHGRCLGSLNLVLKVSTHCALGSDFAEMAYGNYEAIWMADVIKDTVQ